jgi:hypothetical protein
MERNWKDVNNELPKESDRYWGYIEEFGDLGVSYYQNNVYYDKEDNRWSCIGGRVTHWTELLERPPGRLEKINKIVEKIEDE